MYAAVRQYNFDPKNAAEIDRQVKEGFVTILKNSPGFIAYYWVDTGEGQGVSISVFETMAEADHSVAQAADFVQKNLHHLLGHPTVFHGEVKASG